MPRCSPFFYISLIIFAFACVLLQSPGMAEPDKLKDATWQKTYQLYSQIPCLTQDERAYGAEIIAGLGYNSSRIFRRLSMMEGMNFDKSKEAWSILIGLGLSYEQVLVFEDWSDRDRIHIDLGLTALKAIASLSYHAGRSFRNYCKLPRVTPKQALNTIPLLNRLSDAQNMALQQLIALDGISAEKALDGLGIIARLSYYQALAAEAMEKIPKMTADRVADGLMLIRMLNMENAWNAKTLFSTATMTPDKAWSWLVAFFANPTAVQEKQFHILQEKDKEILLKSFYEGGEELIWKLNNLHGITDRFGLEISNQTLLAYSSKRIQEIFAGLSPQVKSYYSDLFYQSKNKRSLISILKKAVAAERSATAHRLTTANIYALLAQGSELYDSSFRNILVPVLKERIDLDFAGDLLAFLQATDPANQLVSSFIVSLAQKGKLTTFFPYNSKEQQKILDLVAHSAFLDEDSIILFSATFMHLLTFLKPSARSFLVERMARQAREGEQAYSRLISVILQYYLEEFPDLLTSTDRSLILRLMDSNGTVNFSGYLATPFAQWKKDGVLSSLSIFHPDDDGRDSFQSNARMLLQSGYTLSLSNQFTVTPLTGQSRKKVQLLIKTVLSNPGTGLPLLFRSMQQNQFAVSFSRKIEGLTIDNAAFVYSDENKQEELLERFVQSGAEMLAQRGHSYWRSEQITDPLEHLKQTGRVNDNDLLGKQRFLSLGSCGGVKAYTRLNQLFLGRVDILATIGSGLANINDPYNKTFFEIVAREPSTITWKDVARELAFIFKGGYGRDYLQPGSLPAILHKILDEEKKRAKDATSRQNIDRDMNGSTG